MSTYQALHHAVPSLDTTGPLLPGSRWSVASLKAMAQFVTAKQFVAAIQVRIKLCRMVI